MRAPVWVVILASLATSGCISKGECDAVGMSAQDMKVNTAPGAVVSLALDGCSTCAHSHVSGYWSKDGIDSNTTGYVEVQLSPQCPVQDITVMGVPRDGEGIADGNVKNCGDVVGYAAYVTNRTNVTLTTMEAHLICPSVGE